MFISDFYERFYFIFLRYECSFYFSMEELQLLISI